MQSLEMRLQGQLKALKALEKDNRLKDEKIKDLLLDLEKKNKIIEIYQVTSIK